MIEAILNVSAYYGIPWIDRNLNLWLNKKRCFKMFLTYPFEYGEILNDSNNLYRCLGKDWFVIVTVNFK